LPDLRDYRRAAGAGLLDIILTDIEALAQRRNRATPCFRPHSGLVPVTVEVWLLGAGFPASLVTGPAPPEPARHEPGQENASQQHNQRRDFEENHQISVGIGYFTVSSSEHPQLLSKGTPACS
jgi:hypothetical protein